MSVHFSASLIALDAAEVEAEVLPADWGGRPERTIRLTLATVPGPINDPCHVYLDAATARRVIDALAPLAAEAVTA